MIGEASRRVVLKRAALGAGATLLSPLLARLRAEAAGVAPPRRFVFVVQSNGFQPEHLLPVGVDLGKRAGDTHVLPNDRTEEISLVDRDLPDPIAALSPFKQRLAIVNGLSGRIAEGGTGGHSTNHGCLGCYPGNLGPMFPTVDVELAVAAPGVVLHVGLGVLAKPEYATNDKISADAGGRAVPLQCSPERAYNSLFGSVADGGSREEFRRRTNLLDFMADDVRRARSELAAEERAKLDQYVAAFESLGRRQEGIEQLKERLRAAAPRIDARLANPSETNRLAAQFEIAAAALIGGLTNVVTIASGGGGQNYLSFPDLGVPIDGHEYGHGKGTNALTAADCFVAVRKYHAGLVADLAARLEAVREGDGTMLDHTSIVWLSDSGEAHHPKLYDWPVVVLGNLGGRLRTGGRFLMLPPYGKRGHRTLANFHLTLLEAAGVGRESFGMPDVKLRDLDQKGPVSELLG